MRRGWGVPLLHGRRIQGVLRKKLSVLFAAALMTLSMMVAGAMPAFAQEGQVEQGPEHANSICSFSGLNDTPNAPAPEGGRVQSYGQEVRNGFIEPSEVKSGPPSPGTFCNPEKGPFEGPFPEEVQE